VRGGKGVNINHRGLCLWAKGLRSGSHPREGLGGMGEVGPRGGRGECESMLRKDPRGGRPMAQEKKGGQYGQLGGEL